MSGNLPEEMRYGRLESCPELLQLAVLCLPVYLFRQLVTVELGPAVLPAIGLGQKAATRLHRETKSNGWKPLQHSVHLGLCRLPELAVLTTSQVLLLVVQVQTGDVVAKLGLAGAATQGKMFHHQQPTLVSRPGCSRQSGISSDPTSRILLGQYTLVVML